MGFSWPRDSKTEIEITKNSKKRDIVFTISYCFIYGLLFPLPLLINNIIIVTFTSTEKKLLTLTGIWDFNSILSLAAR